MATRDYLLKMRRVFREMASSSQADWLYDGDVHTPRD